MGRGHKQGRLGRLGRGIGSEKPEKSVLLGGWEPLFRLSEVSLGAQARQAAELATARTSRTSRAAAACNLALQCHQPAGSR